MRSRKPRARDRVKDPFQCSLIFRGHINVFDYHSAFRAVFETGLKPRVFYLTFLREPVSRAISEFRHITEGLVAQFGPVFFRLIISVEWNSLHSFHSIHLVLLGITTLLLIPRCRSKKSGD